MNGLVIPNTPIAVDFWKPRQCPHVRLYFLTHIHADHTAGLTSSWNYHKIYCSEVTKKLAQVKLGIMPEFLVSLPMDQSVTLPLDERGTEFVTVTIVGANHCPGAVMLLLEGYFGRILYSGDFRFTKSMATDPTLCQNNNSKVIDVLYLDNTYCDPKCIFPTRAEATIMVVNVIRQHPGHNIVIGLHAIGKEELLEKIALTFKSWIAVDPARLNFLRISEQADVFSIDVEGTRFRVVNAREITKLNVQKWNKEQPTIAILPTCLYMGADNPFRNIAEIFVIPYSDHSSFAELKEFVGLIQPKKVVPIVRKHRGTEVGFSNPRTNMSVFDDRLNPEPQTEFAVPSAVRKFMSVDNDCLRTSNAMPLKRQASSISCRSRKKMKPCGVVFTLDPDNSVNYSPSKPENRTKFSESVTKTKVRSSESFNGNSSAAVNSIVNNSYDKEKKVLKTVRADEEKLASVFNGGKSLTSKCTTSNEISDKGKDIDVIIIDDSDDDESVVAAMCQVTPTKDTCQHNGTRCVYHHRTAHSSGVNTTSSSCSSSVSPHKNIVFRCHGCTRCPQHGGMSSPFRKNIFYPCHSNTNSPNHNKMKSFHCNVHETNSANDIIKSTSIAGGSSCYGHKQSSATTAHCGDVSFDSNISSCGDSEMSHEADVTSYTKDGSISCCDGDVTVSHVESSHESDANLQCDITSVIGGSTTSGGVVLSCNDVTSCGASVTIFGNKMISHHCSVISHSSDGISHGDSVTASGNDFTSHDGITTSGDHDECCVTSCGGHRTTCTRSKATSSMITSPSNNTVSSSSDHSQPNVSSTLQWLCKKQRRDQTQSVSSRVSGILKQASCTEAHLIGVHVQLLGSSNSKKIQISSESKPRRRLPDSITALASSYKKSLNCSDLHFKSCQKKLTSYLSTNATKNLSEKQFAGNIENNAQTSTCTSNHGSSSMQSVWQEAGQQPQVTSEVKGKSYTTVAQAPNKVLLEDILQNNQQTQVSTLLMGKSHRHTEHTPSQVATEEGSKVLADLEAMNKINSTAVQSLSRVSTEERSKVLTNLEAMDKIHSTVVQTPNQVSTEERSKVLTDLEAMDKIHSTVVQIPSQVFTEDKAKVLADLEAMGKIYSTVVETPNQVSTEERSKVLTDLEAMDKIHSTVVETPSQVSTGERSKVLTDLEAMGKIHSTVIQTPSQVFTEDKAKVLTDLEAMDKIYSTVVQTPNPNKVSIEEIVQNNQQFQVSSEAVNRTHSSVLQTPIEADKKLKELTDLNQAMDKSVLQTSKNFQLSQQPLVLPEIKNRTHSNVVQAPSKVLADKITQDVQQLQNIIERTHSTVVQTPSEVLIEEKAKQLTHLDAMHKTHSTVVQTPSQILREEESKVLTGLAVTDRHCAAILQTPSEGNAIKDGQQPQVLTETADSSKSTVLQQHNVVLNEENAQDDQQSQVLTGTVDRHCSTVLQTPSEVLREENTKDGQMSQEVSKPKDKVHSGMTTSESKSDSSSKAKTLNTPTAAKRSAVSSAIKASPVTDGTTAKRGSGHPIEPKSDASVDGTPSKRGRGHPPGKAKSPNISTAVKRSAALLASKGSAVMMTTSEPKSDTSVDGTPSKRGRGRPPGKAKTPKTPTSTKRPTAHSVTQVTPVVVLSEKLALVSGTSDTPIKYCLVWPPDRKSIRQSPRIVDMHSSVTMTSQKAGSQTVVDNEDDNSSTGSIDMSSTHVPSHQNLTRALCKPLDIRLTKIDVTSLRPSKGSAFDKECSVSELRNKGFSAKQLKPNIELTACSTSFPSLGKQPRGFPAAKDVHANGSVSEGTAKCLRATSEQQISSQEHEGAPALPTTVCEKQTQVEENATGSSTDYLVSREQQRCLLPLPDKETTNVTEGCSITNSQRQSEKYNAAQEIKTSVNQCRCHEKESKLYEEFRDVKILNVNPVRKTKARTNIYGRSYQFARTIVVEALKNSSDTD